MTVRFALVIGGVLLTATGCGSRPKSTEDRNSQMLAKEAALKDSIGGGAQVTYDSTHGAWIVKAVWPQSPAEEAGIHPGDELVQVGQFMVAGMPATEAKVDAKDPVRSALDAVTPGTVVTYRILRAGSTIDLQVRVDKLASILDRIRVHSLERGEEIPNIQCCWWSACAGCVPDGREPGNCPNICHTV